MSLNARPRSFSWFFFKENHSFIQYFMLAQSQYLPAKRKLRKKFWTALHSSYLGPLALFLDSGQIYTSTLLPSHYRSGCVTCFAKLRQCSSGTAFNLTEPPAVKMISERKFYSFLQNNTCLQLCMQILTLDIFLPA